MATIDGGAFGGTRFTRNLCSGSATASTATDVARAVIFCTARCRRSRRLLDAAGLILFGSLSGACQMFTISGAFLA